MKTEPALVLGVRDALTVVWPDAADDPAEVVTVEPGERLSGQQLVDDPVRRLVAPLPVQVAVSLVVVPSGPEPAWSLDRRERVRW
jgi:hypothetical protein